MKFNIHGQKVEVTEAIKSYIEQKIGKLDKYFENPTDLTANVLIKVRGYEQIVEVTIPAPKLILRGEVAHSDLYASIDLVVEKIERQIRKNKTRSSVKANKRDFMDFIVDISLPKEEVEEEKLVVKRKMVEMKPMSEEEAILQMELLGHEFFVFKNDDDECIFVIYKRKDGHYGIIETR